MIYREGEWVAEVEVLNDESTSNFDIFDLKVVKEIEKSIIGIDEGEEFRAIHPKGKDWDDERLWTLSEK